MRLCGLRDSGRSLSSVGMTVTVSPVTEGDIDALVVSVAGLFAEDAGRHDPTMDLRWPEREGVAYYSRLLGHEDCLLLLARDDDQAVGHLVGRLAGPDSLRTERLAVLESMRVAPGARRTGVGSLLVRYFFTWARDGGARQASVTAYAANDPALRFYARHGFSPKSVTSRAVL
jgi:GNAT superfamily N-acetyltransferase